MMRLFLSGIILCASIYLQFRDITEIANNESVLSRKVVRKEINHKGHASKISRSKSQTKTAPNQVSYLYQSTPDALQRVS